MKTIKFKGYIEDDPILVAMGKVHDMINECSGEIKGKSWSESLRFKLIATIESYRERIISYLSIAPGLKSSADSLSAKIQLIEKKLRKSIFEEGFGDGNDFLRKLKSTLIIDLQAMLQGLEKKPRYNEYESGIEEIKKVA